ncbi:glycerophosphoinositol permease [Savitreella phatthalungensis]
MSKITADPTIEAIAEGRLVDAANPEGGEFHVDNRSEAQKYWNVFVAGGALFSDGYIASSIGPVISIVKKIYPREAKKSQAFRLLSSIVFAGTIVGQLTSGILTDRIGRQKTLVGATVLLIFWSLMCAAAYGYHGSIYGLMAALTTYRCFLGVALGAEYPASSATAIESAAETKPGFRHGIFALVTNCAIDIGFVVGPTVGFIVVSATGVNHLRAAWRIIIALGAVFPCFLLFFRLKMHEPVAYKKAASKLGPKHYWLALRKYWPRLAAISLIWWTYDFTSYSFGTFSTVVGESIQPADAGYARGIAYGAAINAFYVPGAFTGLLLVDRVGPRWTMALGIGIQCIIGFFFYGFYANIAKSVAGYTVLTGFFLAFGEWAGDTIGMVSAASFPSPVRGQFYAVAAAIGKSGAFIGAYCFEWIAQRGDPENPDSVKAYRANILVGSVLALVATITCIFLPRLSQDAVQEENAAWAAYLQEHGAAMEHTDTNSVASSDVKTKN